MPRPRPLGLAPPKLVLPVRELADAGSPPADPRDATSDEPAKPITPARFAHSSSVVRTFLDGEVETIRLVVFDFDYCILRFNAAQNRIRPADVPLRDMASDVADLSLFLVFVDYVTAQLGARGGEQQLLELLAPGRS